MTPDKFVAYIDKRFGKTAAFVAQAWLHTLLLSHLIRNSKCAENIKDESINTLKAIFTSITQFTSISSSTVETIIKESNAVLQAIEKKHLH